MQQGFGNALQMQRQLVGMQALNSMLGGGNAPAQSMPSAQAMPPVTGAANVAGLSGPSAGMGAYAPPTPISQMSAAAAPSGPSIYGKTPQQLFQQGMMMNVAGIPGGGDLMKIAVEHDPTLAAQMPTDITKMGVQGGMSPADIQAANAAGVAKANYIAPVNARPGSILRNPLTMQPMAFNPNIPAGGTPVFDASGNVVGINTIPGAAGVTAEMAAAKAGGEGSMLPYSGVDAAGNPLPVTNRTAAATQNGVPGFSPFQNAVRQVESGGNPMAVNPASGAAGSMQTMPATSANPGFGVRPAANNSPAELQRVGADYASAMQQKYGNDTDAAVAYNWGPQNADKWIAAGRPWKMLPKETQGFVGQVHAQMQNFAGNPSGAPAQGGGQIYAAPPMGAPTFAQGQVKQMQDRWGALRDQNASAQTVISQLQNIAQLAPQAITGAEADRRAYANGLLSLVGVPGAQDAKTATDLLDKYSNQIIAKLGQGGLGTDAARSIVSAGNPNAHMTVPAIQEAVRNLSGQYQMVQAKASVLQQFANGNDPAGYTKAETAFDKNADPRIWEWRSIQDPAQRQQFAAKVLKQDPKFGQKIQTLEQLGALQ
ncbi:hypothetical protein WK62_05175 [Burkholderia ubonensis]|nr:hypothetical protein WK62_05175 [Burkholderia ubonensis]